MKDDGCPKYAAASQYQIPEDTPKLSAMELSELFINLVSLQMEAFHIVHDLDRKIAPRLLQLEVLNKRAMDAFIESGLVCAPQDLTDSHDEWPYTTES